jgi:hypothetical protein
MRLCTDDNAFYTLIPVTNNPLCHCERSEAIFEAPRLRSLFRVKRGIPSNLLRRVPSLRSAFLAMTETEVANESTKLKEMTIVVIMFMFVVGVAQWLRRQVVALEIVGSNPTAHPF